MAQVKVGLVTRSALLPQHTLGARALAAKAMRDKGPVFVMVCLKIT